MKSTNCKIRTNFAIQESKNINGATNRIQKILDAKYEKANLKEIISKLKYFNSDEQFFNLQAIKETRKHV